MVRCIDPDKVNKYKEVPLSRKTNTDRQHELACNVTEQLKNIIQKKNVYYSLALDESTDSTDSAQVLYFIRAITDDFQLFEELLALGTLKGRTRGIDIFSNFKEQCHKVGLNFTNLVSVCTDGAPAMMAKNEGFTAYLKRETKDSNVLISFHCILHQQNFCAKSVILNDTLQKVINIVNYIRANATKHRQFRNTLLMDDEVISVDLPYHSKVRWLSQGKVLVKILSLRRQITDFFKENNKHCDLSDPNFYRDVAFLCHVMSKQNELNISLQGRNKSIYDMWQKIQAFRKKLLFFKSLLAQSKLSEEHFPQFTKVMSENEEDIYESFEEYESVLNSLIEEYNKRFNDFEKHNITLKLAFQPHLVDVSEASEELQMELIEMSEDNILKSLFDNREDPIEIWKKAVEYPRLREHARRLISCFSTTYCCESTFSYLTQIKNSLRTQLTDKHLEDQLKLRTTMLEPDIKMLSQKKQTQRSH